MRPIDLSTAVREIYQIVDQRRRRDKPLRSPFFLIVGAGVSVPFIPLASEIEERCRQEARRYDTATPPQLKPGMQSYSYWLHRAYPSPEELQTYLRGLMQGKPISKANLRLAHLLLDGRIARTVFTPNFDDMAIKALELFGTRPLVCDHPLTVSRIRIESEDIQVIHVHGSYWFYDCCNLQEEISDRSGYGPMSVLLDQSLRDHSPLVLGYSGWDGDLLMSALHRRISAGKLGTPAFWFCHTRESMDSLPDWLKGSNDVQFVLPDDPGRASAVPSTEQRLEPTILAAPRPESAPEGGEAPSPTARLSADKALDALVRRFQPEMPPLIQNPLAFYADHLNRLLGVSDPESETDTYYGFHNVIARVQRACASEAAEEPDALQRFREAMSKADYRQAIKSANETDLDKLSAKGRGELASALMDAATGLDDNSDDETTAYDLIVRIGDALASDGGNLHLRTLVSEALLSKGVALGAVQRGKEAIAAYGEVVRRFGDAAEPALRVQIASALFNKGFTLATLGLREEAIAAYDEVARCFADSTEPAVREQVAKAVINKGFALWTLNRSEEAIDAFEGVARGFADATEPAFRALAARALVNKGAVFGILDRDEEAIAAYDEVVRRFADAAEPATRGEVAKALVNKGGTLGILNRKEEAIAVYDEVVRRFAGANELALREQVAKALYDKGFALGALNRSEEAIAAYDEVVRRFADAAEPPLRELAAKALYSKGFTLRALNRSEEAIAAYDEVVRRFADAAEPPLRELAATALYSKGFTLGTLDRSDEAIAVYDEVVHRFAGAAELPLREQVAKAFFGKGFALGTLNRSEEAIAVYDEVVRRFADAAEPALREQVANALANKGFALEVPNRELAIASYEELLSRFDGAPESEIAHIVKNARQRIEKLRGEDAGGERIA